VAEIKDKESNPDSESDYENTGKRQVIDTNPTAIVATATIQPEEPTNLEEGERLFHSQMWVKGVRKTGPRSNKIKQMQKQNTEDTQYKRDTDLRGSPSVGYVHQRNCQVLA
jgi:hypothetical protein